MMMSKGVFMDTYNFANVAVYTESRIPLFERINLLPNEKRLRIIIRLNSMTVDCEWSVNYSQTNFSFNKHGV